MECKRCKGTGEMAIDFSEGGKKWTRTEIRCIDCDGSGEISEAKAKAIEDEKALWCSCGNPSNDSIFWDDGEHPKCSKHCWTCKDCGKIIQVG